MPEALAREIGLLRTLVEHLERRSLPFETLTQEIMRRESLGHVRRKAGGIISIRMPGHSAFPELTNCLLNRLPAMKRGATYIDIQTELFSFIEDYVDRNPSSVGSTDAETLIAHFERWFSNMSSPRRVFVPCVLSRTSAPRFEIGPVAFEFVDRVAASDIYHRDGNGDLGRRAFDDLVRWMYERDANWLARISVDGCEQKRAEEIAELAVDLVIVALQLAAPNLDTRTMARLDARRGTSQKRTISETNGRFSSSWTSKEPGMTIRQGTLTNILQKAAPIVTSVGNVVRSFASGSFRLPIIEQAWCDAAYWLHQALAESIDTIAIAKLETALEVLLHAKSTKGSEQRILEVLSAIFDLGPDDSVAAASHLTACQFARNVVRDRSRILHGTWSTLSTPSMDRRGMEGFVVTVLRRVVLELEAYANSACPADDIDKFLHWVRQRKRNSSPSAAHP
jgi:hypothetical protein